VDLEKWRDKRELYQIDEDKLRDHGDKDGIHEMAEMERQTNEMTVRT
jgi:hypothetical protein